MRPRARSFQTRAKSGCCGYSTIRRAAVARRGAHGDVRRRVVSTEERTEAVSPCERGTRNPPTRRQGREPAVESVAPEHVVDLEGVESVVVKHTVDVERVVVPALSFRRPRAR